MIRAALEFALLLLFVGLFAAILPERARDSEPEKNCAQVLPRSPVSARLRLLSATALAAAACFVATSSLATQYHVGAVVGTLTHVCDGDTIEVGGLPMPLGHLYRRRHFHGST